MFGFFKFLKELFNGTYFDDNSVNPSDNPGAFVDRPSNNSMVSSGSDTLSGVQRTDESSVKGLTGFLNQLGQLIPALVNRITAGELTGAEREQNAFNAEQAQIDRDFQERMANTQYQRSVADMRAAGVNPALAIGNGGAAAPSGAMAQGSGSADYAGASLGDILQLAMIKPQMELLHAQVDKTKAEAGKTRSETNLVDKHIDWFDKLSQSTLDDVYSKIDQREVQNALDKQGISESMARESLAIQQTINAKISGEYISKLNDTQLKYQDALTKYTDQKTSESAERVKLFAAQIDGIYQQAILHAAQAGYFTQQEQNLLVEHGILEYQKDQNKFTVDHQKADRNWRIVSTVIGSVQSAAMSAGSLAVGAGALAKGGLLGSSSVAGSPWSFHNTGGYNFITY